MRPGTGIGFSALVHALAVLGLSSMRSPPPPAVERTSPTFLWVTMPQTARLPTPAEAKPATQAPSPPSTRARTAAKPPGSGKPPAPAAPAMRAESRPAAPADEESPPAPFSPPSAEERAVDLVEARERAAVEVLRERERAGSYRSFTFPGTIAEQEAFDEAERVRRVERGLQAPLTAFDSPAKGRAGITDTNAFGQTTRWISDDCYQTTGTNNLFLLPAMAALFAIPTTHCAPPLPRADLFATAKPAYLMDPEERAATDAAIERRERLRRPTTGAVMSLEKE